MARGDKSCGLAHEVEGEASYSMAREDGLTLWAP